MTRQLNIIGLYIAAACVIGSVLMAASEDLETSTANNVTMNTKPTAARDQPAQAPTAPANGGAVSVVGSLVMISACLLTLRF